MMISAALLPAGFAGLIEKQRRDGCLAGLLVRNLFLALGRLDQRMDGAGVPWRRERATPGLPCGLKAGKQHFAIQHCQRKYLGPAWSLPVPGIAEQPEIGVRPSLSQPQRALSASSCWGELIFFHEIVSLARTRQFHSLRLTGAIPASCLAQGLKGKAFWLAPIRP